MGWKCYYDVTVRSQAALVDQVLCFLNLPCDDLGSVMVFHFLGQQGLSARGTSREPLSVEGMPHAAPQ